MGRRIPSIATPETEFRYGIDTRQVIPDTKNVKGELWLYVNKHPDNRDLIKALLKLNKGPSCYSRPSKKGQSLFAYEFIFKQGTKVLNKLKKLGFKLQ